MMLFDDFFCEHCPIRFVLIIAVYFRHRFMFLTYDFNNPHINLFLPYDFNNPELM